MLQLAARISAIQGRYACLKDSKIPTLTSSQSQHVSKFHKTLKEKVGAKITELQVKTNIILEISCYGKQSYNC